MRTHGVIVSFAGNLSFRARHESKWYNFRVVLELVLAGRFAKLLHVYNHPGLVLDGEFRKNGEHVFCQYYEQVRHIMSDRPQDLLKYEVNQG